MYTLEPRRLVVPALAALSLLTPALALAEEVPVLNSGDTAWMLTATALVLFMTIPGLALFYGGMVRAKLVDLVIGLNIAEEQETEGLDLSQHGERGYIL